VRLVQITIPSGKRETVFAALDDEGIDYVVSDETSGREFDGIAYIPLPTNAVEPTLETLRQAGVDDTAYTVVIDANTVVSRRFEELQSEYANEHDSDRIARDELVTAAAELAPSLPTYIIMTIVSAVVATGGLLLDSPAVVVGSMVIAPLVGPALSASVGTVVRDREMFRRGVRLQILGLLLSILAAFVFAFVVRHVHLVPPLEDVTAVPEIRERVAPDFLMLAIAIGAGVAGALSLLSGVSAALVGVMIAVALIPPAATVGIGLAWEQPRVSLGSVVLLLVNLLSINLASLLVFWYKGYRPERWFYRDTARKAILTRGATLLVAILVLSAFLGGVTLDSFQRASTGEQVQTEAESVIDAFNTTHEIQLVDVEVIYPQTLPFQDPERIIVTVGVPPGESVSGLAPVMQGALRERTDTDAKVQIRYLQVESASGDPEVEEPDTEESIDGPPVVPPPNYG
jgi:uncharacterized hydrophobic protein (TIGR00341 family)